MVENRRHRRYERKLRVTWRNEELCLQSFTKDICAGGVFIITNSLVRPKEILHLELTSTGAAPALRCYGRVIWVNHGQVECFPPGFGVEILGMDQQSLESLLSFCEEMDLDSPCWAH